MGRFGVDFGSILGRFGVDFRSMLGRFGVRFEVGLGSIWGRFGMSLGSVWARFGVGLVNSGGIWGLGNRRTAITRVHVSVRFITAHSGAAQPTLNQKEEREVGITRTRIPPEGVVP